jgi:hypothetical protein
MPTVDGTANKRTIRCPVPISNLKKWVKEGCNTVELIRKKSLAFSRQKVCISEKNLSECKLPKFVLNCLAVKSSDEVTRYGTFGFKRTNRQVIDETGRSSTLKSAEFCVCCYHGLNNQTEAYRHDMQHGTTFEELSNFAKNDPHSTLYLVKKNEKKDKEKLVFSVPIGISKLLKGVGREKNEDNKSEMRESGEEAEEDVGKVDLPLARFNIIESRKTLFPGNWTVKDLHGNEQNASGMPRKLTEIRKRKTGADESGEKEKKLKESGERREHGNVNPNPNRRHNENEGNSGSGGKSQKSEKIKNRHVNRNKEKAAGK